MKAEREDELAQHIKNISFFGLTIRALRNIVEKYRFITSTLYFVLAGSGNNIDAQK